MAITDTDRLAITISRRGIMAAMPGKCRAR
jgi:hypothetical protein